MVVTIKVFAQTTSIETTTVKSKAYTTSRINSNTPVIDGNLDDECWKNANWGTDFVQFEPKQDVPPTQQTQFAILYDDNNLYVAIKALDSEPDKIVKRITRRDETDGDWVGIGIDSYDDNLTGFFFSVSAAGSKEDFLVTNNTNEDDSWDPLWEVKTSIGADGWYAEMRIPYSQLRFSKKDRYEWGLEFVRFVYRNNEKSFWAPLDKASSQFVGQFGVLHGIESIKPKKDIEIFPFGLTKLTLSEIEEGNPFATGQRWTASGGVDGKISLTNNITLNFTINPDFGQVEADPSEVNLSNFESYFSEKRPFFVEGSNIFKFPFDINNNGREGLFYSRRLGREPHIYYEETNGEFVRRPQQTNILGAVKISGRTDKGTSIGLLNAVTQKMYTKIDDNGTQSKSPVEPFTNYFVGSIQQELQEGNTVISAMLTSTNRLLDEQEFNSIPRSAYTGGVNYTKYWKEKTYFLTARSFFSSIYGSKESIFDLQQSPTHNYQRPDATHVSLNPNATNLSGWGGSFEAGKQSGHYNYILLSSWSSPGLDFNDIGFKQSADQFMYGFWNGYSEWEPKNFYNSYNINGSIYQALNFESKKIETGLNFNSSMEFKNYYGFHMGGNYRSDGISTTMLRGGPSMKSAGNTNYWIGFYTDSRKKIVVYPSMGGNIGFYDSYRSRWYDVTVKYKPTNNISLSISPEFSHSNAVLQYVETIDVTEEDTYLFASLERKTFQLSARINYGITPDMSLQFYAQPFLFSGDYSNLKTITNPQADIYEDRFHVLNDTEAVYDRENNQYNLTLDNATPYTIDNPDFHFLQFRSNLVYRWEYKPGSVFYLVWAQGRTTDGPSGIFNFGDYNRELFKSKPQNDFLVKVSYAFIF